MDEERGQFIDEQTEVFGFGKIQDLLTLHTHCIKHGITMEELRQFATEYKPDKIKESLENRSERIANAQKVWEVQARKCSDCGRPMRLYPVNTGPRDQTGDNSKSVWMCQYKKCLLTEYSNDTVDQWLEAYGIELVENIK